MSNIKERSVSEYTSNRYSLSPGSSYVEIFDSNMVVVDGCRGVLVCTETQIRLSLASRAIVITGSELVITLMTGQTINICGDICSVEFI